jgi:hypothetical protein
MLDSLEEEAFSYMIENTEQIMKLVRKSVEDVQNLSDSELCKVMTAVMLETISIYIMNKDDEAVDSAVSVLEIPEGTVVLPQETD